MIEPTLGTESTEPGSHVVGAVGDAQPLRVPFSDPQSQPPNRFCNAKYRKTELGTSNRTLKLTMYTQALTKQPKIRIQNQRTHLPFPLLTAPEPKRGGDQSATRLFPCSVRTTPYDSRFCRQHTSNIPTPNQDAKERLDLGPKNIYPQLTVTKKKNARSWAHVRIYIIHIYK